MEPLKTYKKMLEAKSELTLQVKIKASAKETKISEVLEDGRIKISLRPPAQEGKANKELIKFLATTFQTSKTNIEIIKGELSPDKTIKIYN